MTGYKMELMESSISNSVKFINDFIKKEEIDINNPPDENIKYRADEIYSKYKEFLYGE